MSAQPKTEIVATKTTTALAVVTASIAEINTFEAGIAALEEKHKGVVYDLKSSKGMAAAKEARQEVRKPRYALEKIQREAKRPLNSLKEAIDSQTEALVKRIAAIEDPLHEAIVEEQDRLHNEAVAKATAERERVERLEARIAAIYTMPYEANGLDSKTCQAILDEARAMPIGDDWQEFREKAQTAKVATVASLEGVLSKAKAAEAEAARIIAERAELESLRAEQAKRDAEARALQAAENARIAEAQRIERELLDAERAEIARQQEEARKAQAAENERLAVERKKIADEQQAARAATEQAERMRADAVTFRAHFEHMSPVELDLLKQQSDATPSVDVFSLPKPVDAPAYFHSDASEAMDDLLPAPCDEALCQCIEGHFKVSALTAHTWLIGYGK